MGLTKSGEQYPMDFVDIGYDYLIDNAGRVYKGSKRVIYPGVTQDYPGETLNIAIIGNFMDVSPSDEAKAALQLMLDCLAKNNVIAADYEVAADYKTPLCGRELYKCIKYLSHYRHTLTEAEKKVYTDYLTTQAFMDLLNGTNVLFCGYHKDNAHIMANPPCKYDSPPYMPYEEVIYILDHLDDPQAAEDYYIGKGEYYKGLGYDAATIRWYILFTVHRMMVVGVPDLYLTAATSMYYYKYKVLLSVVPDGTGKHIPYGK